MSAGPAWAGWIDLQAEPTPGATVPRFFKIEIDQVAGGGDLRRVLALGDSTKTTQIEVPAGTWKVSALAEGLWAEEQLVSLESRQERRGVVVRFWPAGFIAGQFDPPPTPAPLHVTLSFAPAQAGRGAPNRTVLRCPIKDNRWECAVPAGVLDVEVELHGFVPNQRFGLRVAAGQKVDLGPLPLKRGASVRGFVRTPDGNPAPSGTRVRLLSGLGDALEAVADFGGRRLEQPVNQRGFYQLSGVPTGPLVLEAESQEWAKSATPVLVEGAANQVRAATIVLERPVSMELQLRPPLGPDGEPWTVELVSVGSGMLAVGAPRPATAGGRFRMGGLSAGRYLVNIAAADGNRWLTREVTVPGSGATEIDVDTYEIRGTVRLGGKLLPRARLLFGGEFGAVRVATVTDEDGRFATPLPRGAAMESWEVQIVSSDPPVNRMLRKLEPTQGSAGEFVLDLDIPDVRLRGRVVDVEGVPQQGIVDVQSLEPLERLSQARTDSNGEFDVVGLSAGRAIVLFRGRTAASAVTRVKLEDGRPTRIELVGRPLVPIKGRVLNSEGDPVAGASVHPFPAQWTSLWLPPRAATTDEQGRFEAGVPFDTLALRLAVRAPGYALTAVDVRAGDEPAITVGSYGGTLVVDYPRIRAVDFYEEPAAYLVSGRWVNLLDNALLQGWSRSGFALGQASAVDARFPARGGVGPTSLVLPLMNPGPYAACLLTVKEVLDIEAGRPLPNDKCAEGVLAPWGVLPLSVGDLP